MRGLEDSGASGVSECGDAAMAEVIGLMCLWEDQYDCNKAREGCSGGGQGVQLLHHRQRSSCVLWERPAQYHLV